jgi:hypothetical protein
MKNASKRGFYAGKVLGGEMFDLKIDTFRLDDDTFRLDDE